jgi:hypothetical protein
VIARVAEGWAPHSTTSGVQSFVIRTNMVGVVGKQRSDFT